MKYKKGFIFICLIICLFSIASVVASDVNDTVVANEDQIGDDEVLAIEEQDINEVGATEENELSATTGTFTDLANDIANADGELILSKNYSYFNSDSDLKNELILNKPITLDGNGFTINFNKNSIQLKIKSNIIFKNIHFENFKGQNDGALIFTGVTNGEMINCTFTNNRACNGGCIYASQSNIIIENCNFTGNKVDSSYKSSGGCIYISSSDLSIRNTFFNENWGGSTQNSIAGGIYATSSNLKIENSSFIGNSVSSSGGAIYIKKSILILNSSKFINNRANDGGGIYSHSSNLRIENSCFLKNCAHKEGAAIKFYSSESILNFCNFTNNEARYGGAALYYSSSMGKLENCKFKANTLSNRITTPIDKQYIQQGCLFNCEFDNPDKNIAIGGGLRNITELHVKVTNNIIDITIVNPNFYQRDDFDGQGYFLSIEKYPFPTSHNSFREKDSLKLNNNHVVTSLDYIPIGLNQYRVFYSNFINEFYYYFNITKTAKSSIFVESITAQQGTNSILKVNVDDKLNVYGEIQGEIVFTINGKKYNVPVKNGESKITISLPKSIGTFNYQVTFNPYSKYVNSSSTNLKITSKMGTKVTVKSVTGYQKKKVKITAIVKDENGNTIKNGKVIFNVNGNIYKANVKNGKASITIKYPKAHYYDEKTKNKGKYRYDTIYYKSTYTCSAKFKGDSKYISSSSSFKMTSKAKPIKHKWRIYNYRTFTLPVKNGFKVYKKSVVIIIAKKSLTTKNKLFVGVGKDEDHGIKFKVKKHYKKNGKWKWDNWFYCNKNQYMETTYGKAIKIDQVKINCYSPYFVKIY